MITLMKKLIGGPKLGDLNGGWAFLAKVTLLLVVPSLMGLIYNVKTLAELKTSAEYRQKAIDQVRTDIRDIEVRLDKIERKLNP